MAARRATPLLGAALAIACLLAALSGTAAALAADDDGDGDGSGIGLVVTVPTSTASPSPSPTSPRPTPTPTRSGGAVVPGTSSTPTPAPDDLDTLPDGDFSIGGILYVSGLTTSARSELNPFDGTVFARFTVKNVSTSIITTRVTFWLTNAFGARLSESDVAIVRIKPGESKLVQEELGGAGQWTFVTAHFTLTPPATVEGTALHPLTRDALVLVLPWLLLVLIALGLLAAIIVRVAKAGQLEEPVEVEVAT